MPLLSGSHWLLLWLLIHPCLASAQGADRIWGRITTVSGETYEGFIRWDRNEGSWSDILHGSKEIPRESYDLWLEHRRGEPPVRSIELAGYLISWNEEDPDFPSIVQSGVRFGHLAGLTVTGDDRVALTLRSGERIELSGGASDIGTGIRDFVVEDAESGSADLAWDDLEQVVFGPAPEEARPESRRLYGTVENRQGDRFAGHVAWDLDEILEADELQGEDERGRDREIPFGRIRAIERTDQGTRVTLADGEILHLSGTNDVDRGHRGVQISDPALGMVEVEWEDFASVRFHDSTSQDGYQGYDGGHRLTGTVVTVSGERISGRLRWDTDQHWSWEMMNASTEGARLTVELGRISGIDRSDSGSARVTLLDGRTFPLRGTDGSDWAEKGVLVELVESRDSEEAGRRYVVWRELRRIAFEHASDVPGPTGSPAHSVPAPSGSARP